MTLRPSSEQATRGIERTEWAFDQKSVWKGLRAQAGRERSFGDALPLEQVEAWRRDMARWNGVLDGVRVFSGTGRSLEVSHYDPATLRRLGVSTVRRIAKGAKGWPGGELGSVLEGFHRLVPLSEMWSWSAADESYALFPLARPTAWPLLLSMSVLGPLARALPGFARAADVWVTGFGFSGERMELCFRPLRPLPEREFAAAEPPKETESPSRA